ncbi:hypothetical protein N7532_011218 [Penicillium argentinense]|uniref:Protein kinase domain-containing protein n=1 Tax=Penicillium argentinense TaxID=1131581 RepID=A0A9W9EI51_9EURO|nr:uncharacterized protein N7532_011218 [Penicillium argentinense]KAJ5082175.1 hypothetical protein N7532_011218 [Penicillium argentinense]
MKDHSRHQDAWTGIAVHRHDTHSDTSHHHYSMRPNLSPGAQDAKIHNAQSARKHSWPFFSHDRPVLASASTDRRPLMRSETDATSASRERSNTPDQALSFMEKYGRCLEILHYGSNSTVRLHENQAATNTSSPRVFAIKVYRYNILDSSNPLTRSISCSQSSISNLHPRHPNILPITDLLYNERSELCLVTPFCGGGDLHGLISLHGTLPSNEVDCLIAQILRALSFLHQHEIAHRDIRLETILLTSSGAVKLAGFGDEHIRRLWNDCTIPLETDEERQAYHSQRAQSQPSSWYFSLPWLLSPFKSHQEQNARGKGGFHSSTASFPGMSLPYIPPEGFRRHLTRHRSQNNGDAEGEDDDDDDPRPTDVWATAIIYLALITGRLPWRSARPNREDTRYMDYLHGRRGEDGYPPIEALGRSEEEDYYHGNASVGVDL